jgi:hypothetical protein
MERSKEIKGTKYLNPYIGGVLLGLVLLAANFVSGRGLGASGAIKSTVVTAVTAVAPSSSEKSGFVKEFRESHQGNPMKTWLVFEMLGVIVGGFISGAIAGRLKLKVEHSPKITSRKRMENDPCADRWYPLWIRITAWQRMYQRLGIKWNGCSLSRWFHYYDGYLRNRLCISILFQEELDIEWYNGVTA